MKSRTDLNIAELFILERAEEYPLIYPDSMHVFISCIFSSSDDWYWENGIIRSNPNYEHSTSVSTMPEDLICQFFLKPRLYFTIHFSSFDKSAPIKNMPDDMHVDWIDHIRGELYALQRITPDLYEKLSIADCIYSYGKETNQHANYERNNQDYRNFYDKILPSLFARLDAIEDTQRLGKIPEYKYIGMHI